MRLDFAITELNVGGAEKMLAELAVGAARRQCDVRVLSLGSAPRGEQCVLADRLGEAGVAVEYGGFDHWSQFVSAARWLTGMIADRRPDLCQSFLFHANCLTARAANPAGLKRWIGGLRVAERRPMRLFLERRAVLKMSHLVCVSEQVKTFALEHLQADPRACSVIPNGVDVQRYQSAVPFDWTEIGWPADSRVVLFIGRLHPQKGLELLQQQFAAMIEKEPSRKLLLVGHGPSEESLRQWADQIGRQKVQLLGWRADVAPLMRAASLLVLPSHYEGMPNVVLEAMAAARPVVCSRVEGSQELLGEIVSGADSDDMQRSQCLQRSQCQGFDPGDSETMARLVDDFLGDAALCSRVGLANQQFVAEHFTIDAMVQRYLDLYESLINSTPLRA